MAVHARSRRRPLFALVAHETTATNEALLEACRGLGVEAVLLSPERALARLRPGDTVLGRLDVRPSLDGVEPGLWQLRLLERRGIRLLNGPSALLRAHDKLTTAVRMVGAGLPHPTTAHVSPGGGLRVLDPPLVVKPRFGSWGIDVVLCSDSDGAARALAELRGRPWFRVHGVLVQEFVPSQGHDLRVVVARGAVIGAIARVPAPGEWRTNVSLGATRLPTEPAPECCALATAAARALSLDLAGVDLIPRATGGYVVLEVNGAVDFTPDYAPGRDVFEAAAESLLAGRPAPANTIGAQLA